MAADRAIARSARGSAWAKARRAGVLALGGGGAGRARPDVAREAGFDAEPLLLEAESSTAEMISSVAERREAALVVVGSRGLRGMSARAAGSVSRRLLETVDRPKLVV